VAGVDTAARTVTTDAGDTHGYGKLLVATGGHPRELDGLPPSERVVYFRSLTDYQKLRAMAGGGARVVVVGGGFIGTEIAAALAPLDVSVTMVYPESRLGERVFPEEVGSLLERAFVEAGVTLRAGAGVSGARQEGDVVTLQLGEHASVDADVVVVGLGIAPAGEVLGEAAGVEHGDDGSIVVDAHLHTGAPDVWAAGDVATYPDAILGRRRVEHEDNAVTMGATAGRIMAGSDEVYDHTPMFYSDVFDHGYEAIGRLDASLETVVDRRENGIVVYYLDDDAVVGVLLFDCDGGLDAATELLARRTRPSNPADLVGTIG
jgi:NADPH-dependent 2,4-dienoyl-CoA reductase/sulfur reductase-like enzyme